MVKKALAMSALLALTACGVTSVDIPGLEKNITDEVRKQAGADATVDCPDEVDWQTGGTFTCEVHLEGGGTETAVAKMLDDKGNVQWDIN